MRQKNKDKLNIRNFCIISHIDHGKSTLADCFLKITKTVPEEKIGQQYLDKMDLEREHGITIKMHPVRMKYCYKGEEYILNLIDTPGHVDFSYEVSRALSCVEGAVLLVDARQGPQAQTLANFDLAKKAGLKIIPVINKIDLPGVDLKKVTQEVVKIFDLKQEDILYTSAKTGQGAEQVLQAVIERVPLPKQDVQKPFKALIFDSFYDNFQGVIAYIRVYQGRIKDQEKVRFYQKNAYSKIVNLGVFTPELKSTKELRAGEIGYIATGLKDLTLVRVGETIVLANDFQSKPIQGYKEPRPMVFADFYPQGKNGFLALKQALIKLSLNDASLEFEPVNHPALGQGWRIGFLGMLHLQITQERLQREYKQEIIISSPTVCYKVYLRNGQVIDVRSPKEMPDESLVSYITEPWVKVEMITPLEYYADLLSLAKSFRAKEFDLRYLGEKQDRVIVYFKMPLSMLISDFYERVKSVSSGYASYSWQVIGYEPADICRLDVYLAKQEYSEFSTFAYKDDLERQARKIAQNLKQAIPRQMFEVRIQVALGGKIIASERIPPYRKDVLAKLYGGDVTRKMKLLEKQKKGKKKMQQMARGINLPSEVYVNILRKK